MTEMLCDLEGRMTGCDTRCRGPNFTVQAKQRAESRCGDRLRWWFRCFGGIVEGGRPIDHHTHALQSWRATSGRESRAVIGALGEKASHFGRFVRRHRPLLAGLQRMSKARSDWVVRARRLSRHRIGSRPCQARKEA